MKVDFDVAFSRVRTEILGAAALGILLVHSKYYINWKGILGKITSYGGVGVCMFIFISGLGLYRSLKLNGGGTELSHFFRKGLEMYWFRI